MGQFRRVGVFLLIGCLLAGEFAPLAAAMDLLPETAQAYDQYVRATESRMKDDLSNGHFLYLDQLPEDLRKSEGEQIRQGDFYIEELHTTENGEPIWIPSGLVHHWVGIAFIAGATYTQTLKVLMDFDKQVEIYKPDVQKSKLIETNGNRSVVFLRYYRKSLVSVVYNANFVANVIELGFGRAEIRSYSTRIAEVRDPGKPDESEYPVGKDHGYMWRLNSYWRIEERDGGVYIQIESIALSRRVPTLLAWLVNPIVRELSRDVIANLLAGTRKGVKDYGNQGALRLEEFSPRECEERQHDRDRAADARGNLREGHEFHAFGRRKDHHVTRAA